LRCCSSSTRSSSSRSEPRGPGPARVALLLLLLAASLGAAGCGADDEQTVPEPAPALGPAGAARFAVGARIGSLDPLRAGSRSGRIVARQIYEPLIGRIRAPFGGGRARAALARSLRPSDDGLTWTARLRKGVRFHDGTLLDAGVVIDNVSRWLADPAAARPLRGLAAADSPRPGLVRFQLDRPLPALPRLLSGGRYGIVAPGSLPARRGGDLRGRPIGTGPFELRGSGRAAALLARNSEWWGSALDLGPGVDSLEFVVLGARGARLEALDRGAVDIADQLRPGPLARRARRGALLSWLSEGGITIGFDPSVRGIDTTRADVSLSSVWLTDLR
jgi:peptide/nickel transport system substrate-binding protein